MIEQTATRLAWLDKRWFAKWEVMGSNPSRTNTQGLKITEENVLPLDILVFSDKDKKP